MLLWKETDEFPLPLEDRGGTGWRSCSGPHRVVVLGPRVLQPEHLSTARLALLPGALTSRAHFKLGFPRVNRVPKTHLSSFSPSLRLNPRSDQSSGVTKLLPILCSVPTQSRNPSHGPLSLFLLVQGFSGRMVESARQSSVGANRLECLLGRLVPKKHLPNVIGREPSLAARNRDGQHPAS